ncbi:hypothetical protein O1L60_29890 [Streptomyces diastatochromogenes]|nr:hypothetical protein [Streptomyces diastatochromogenes]
MTLGGDPVEGPALTLSAALSTALGPSARTVEACGKALADWSGRPTAFDTA